MRQDLHRPPPGRAGAGHGSVAAGIHHRLGERRQRVRECAAARPPRPVRRRRRGAHRAHRGPGDLMAAVVVIGAGLGGLAAAARLAKLGHEVTVLERDRRTGGALGTLEADGFRWDTGAAWTTLPAALRDLFRKSGRPLERVAELVPVTSPRRHMFTDGATLDLPVLDRAEQLHAWRDFADERAAQQWSTLIDGYAHVWDGIRRNALDQPPVKRLPLGVVRTLRPWE